MNDDDQNIPQLFHSVYEEGPFTRCIDCDSDLRSSGMPYVVEKQVVGSQTVFEMAICAACQQRLSQGLSEESREAISRHVRKKLRGTDWMERDPRQMLEFVEMSELVQHPGLALVNACSQCGKPRDECHRYGIVGALQADSLIIIDGAAGVMCPLMICDDCSTKMNDLISKKTRDFWDRFVDEHFDGPPGIEEDWPRPELVLI